jgi:hypothetical protein
MVLFFRRFPTEALAVEFDEIVMTLNVYTNNGMTIAQIERFWISWACRTQPFGSTR